MPPLESEPKAADPDFGVATASPAPVPARTTPRRESRLLLAAVAFQLVVLGWMIGGTMLTFREARTVLVKVEPVDPRDLFRGEYVTLAYDFSRVPAGGIDGFPGPFSTDNADDWLDRPVFVPLIPDDEAGPGRYRSGRPSTRPPGRDVAYIQGTIEGPDRLTYGIESFFLQEGTGSKYEDAAREHRLWAEIDLNPHGMATLRDLKIDPPPAEPPPAEPAPE